MTNNDELAFIAKAALKAGQGSREMVEFRVTANPANILALLAERDADKKRIAELEARTVSVKLPLRRKGSLKFPEGKEKAFLYVPHDFYDADDLEAAMKEAGIKPEVGE
jgi:hypothetical protein